MEEYDFNLGLKYILLIAKQKNITKKELASNIYDYSHFLKMCNGKEPLKIEILLLCAQKLAIPYQRLLEESKTTTSITLKNIEDIILFNKANQNYSKIQNIYRDIKALENNGNDFKKVILSLEGIINAEIFKCYDLAMKNFMDALRLSHPNFDLFKYNLNLLISDDFEIINDIAIIYFYTDIETSKSIYKRVIEYHLNSNTNTVPFIKYCCNYSMVLLFSKCFDRVIEICNLGIDYAIKTNDYILLGPLYYRASLAYAKLENAENSALYLNRCLSIYSLQNRYNYIINIINTEQAEFKLPNYIIDMQKEFCNI